MHCTDQDAFCGLELQLAISCCAPGWLRRMFAMLSDLSSVRDWSLIRSQGTNGVPPEESQTDKEALVPEPFPAFGEGG